MRSLDVCPTEDAIKAFLECLIDPILPTKSSWQDSPSLPQQQLVANQVYAVAILYNYYHRKQWPELEFLDFLQFCKLAVLMRPNLLAYMKLMQTIDDANMSNQEIEPSVTESKIMSAYDICKRLDASTQIPNMGGWPALTVAVFLVDFSKINCFLLSDSLARGVWSIIEKDVDVSNRSSEAATLGTKSIVIKKKIIRRRPTRDDSTIDEDAFRRIAFLAVEEMAGIKQTDISVLESHTVYSLTKEKAVSRFYIMQCKNRDEYFRFPIKDILNRLQGPLISSIGLNWYVTPAVEHFYILPYAGILSAWFSSEVSPDSFNKVKLKSEIVNILNSEAQSEAEIKDGRKRSYAVGTITGRLNKKTNDIGSWKYNEKQSAEFLSRDFSEDTVIVADTTVSEVSNQVPNVIDNCQEKVMDDLEKRDLSEVTTGFQQCVAECENEETASLDISKSISYGHDIMPSTDHALSMHQLCSEENDEVHAVLNPKGIDLCQTADEIHAVLNAKGNDLSQTAVRVILRQRAMLSHQLRNIEDEIAQCDENLRKIAAGGEDTLELKLQCIMDEKSPCQELDHICEKNNWILPTYHVSLCQGGFIATVSMKAMDSDHHHFAKGEAECVPQKARESAAAHLLNKLSQYI